MTATGPIKKPRKNAAMISTENSTITTNEIFNFDFLKNVTSLRSNKEKRSDLNILFTHYLRLGILIISVVARYLIRIMMTITNNLAGVAIYSNNSVCTIAFKLSCWLKVRLNKNICILTRQCFGFVECSRTF